MVLTKHLPFMIRGNQLQKIELPLINWMHNHFSKSTPVDVMDAQPILPSRHSFTNYFVFTATTNNTYF